MEILDVLLTAALASLPGVMIAAWAWFKSNAAQSEAKWDDEAVKFVEDIAKRINDKAE